VMHRLFEARETLRTASAEAVRLGGLAREIAAVDEERLSAHPLRLRAREKRNNRCDVGLFAQAPTHAQVR
jgi:hypothetical protein